MSEQTTRTEPEDKMANAMRNAMACYENIREMVARYLAADDDEAYEEQAEALARDAGFVVFEVGEGVTDDDGEPVESGFYFAKTDAQDYKSGPRADEAEAWLACCDDNALRPDSDEARQAIEEDALSVQVRSGWYSPGEKGEAEEYEILLPTGGPALRIIGSLDRGQPDSAELQCQDWFTPWTDVRQGIDEDVLLNYARGFYFGE